MRHKLCRSFHPWCPGVKTRCLSLMRPPFTSQSEEDGESSDDVIPLKWRTLKCVFLLALASTRRRYSAWQMCVRERKHSVNVNLWYLYFRNLASWRRISYRRRPLNGSRYLGLLTWIRRNRSECYVPCGSWSSTYGTRKESGGAGSECSFTGTAASEISWGAT